MDSSNKKPKVQQHNLKGIKMIDGELHVPISEVIKLCKRFSLYRVKDLADVIERAWIELKINKVKQKDIPVIDTKKSFLGRLFD